MKKEKSKKLILIIGFLLISVGLFIIEHKIVVNEYKDRQEEKYIEEFFSREDVDKTIDEEKNINNIVNKKNNSDEYQYIAIIEIPKINLKRGLTTNKKYNNVKYNIEILDGSKMPDYENGNLILAGHSGTGRIAFLNNLNKLKINDEIYIYYNGIKYIYKYVNNYEVDKTGSIAIHRDKNKNTLTMITCKHNTNKQIVFIAELVDKINY